MALCTIIGVGPNIGYSTAKKFASEGYDLALFARNEERLNSYAQELEAEFEGLVYPTVVDIRDKDQFKSKLGVFANQTDVLIYNAAIVQKSSQGSYNIIKQTLDTGNYGARIACSKILPRMKERGRGTVLFTGSGFAYNFNYNYFAISLDKLKNLLYARELNEEYTDFGVHVGIVTVHGKVGRGLVCDPDFIAEEFYALATQGREDWEFERHVGFTRKR